MPDFSVYPSIYIRGGDLVIELEDQDGFYVSGTSLPLLELKEALEALGGSFDALNTQEKPEEVL